MINQYFHIQRHTRNFLRKKGGILDHILPHRCIVTGEITQSPTGLSPKAWGELNFISDPMCKSCGTPFSYQLSDTDLETEGQICLSCTEYPFSFARARAVLRYDDASKPMVLGFKHGDKTYMAVNLAEMMRQAGHQLLEDADLLIPVPLHWTRLLKRRFNQSMLLAKRLSFITGIACSSGVLKRIKATPVQGHLNTKARKKNVSHAFLVSPDREDEVRGKRIILVDDVFTSGSTANEGAKSLLEAGAKQVDVLCVAKVIRD